MKHTIRASRIGNYTILFFSKLNFPFSDCEVDNKHEIILLRIKTYSFDVIVKLSCLTEQISILEIGAVFCF